MTTLRMSINCKKSLQQLNCDHCVIAVRDLLFRKMFRTLFCFEQQKTSKTLRSNCTQVRWRKKKNKRRQVYITLDLKICVVIDHREHQNVVQTSVTHSPAAHVPLPFLPHFDVICDLLLNRSTATLVHVGRVTLFPSSLSYLSRDPGCVPHDLGKGQIHVSVRF